MDAAATDTTNTDTAVEAKVETKPIQEVKTAAAAVVGTETKVETGIRGVDGYVEIVSGLKEGDKIVASPNI